MLDRVTEFVVAKTEKELIVEYQMETCLENIRDIEIVVYT